MDANLGLQLDPSLQGGFSLANAVGNPQLNVPTGAYSGTTMPTSTGANLNLNPAGTQETILGMGVPNFAAVMGAAGSAFAPKDSWQQKLGALASGLGKAALQDMASTAQNKGAIENIKTAMKSDPVFKNMMQKYFNGGGTPLPTVQPDSSSTGSTGGQ